MIIQDLLESFKRVPYCLYSYLVLGCVHTSLSSLPIRQPSGQYTRTCMNCGTQVPTFFSIETVNYPNRRAIKLGKKVEKMKLTNPKRVTPIRRGKRAG